MNIMIPALFLAAACASLAALPAAATEPQEAAPTQAVKADAKKMQSHSHLQEKSGIAPHKKSAKDAAPAATDDTSAEPKAAGAKSAKVKADKDNSRHIHPRDGK